MSAAAGGAGLPGQGGSDTDLINTASQLLKNQRDDVRASNRERKR